MKRYQIMFWLASGLVSCSTRSDESTGAGMDIEVIQVDCESEKHFGAFDDYFAESSIVALETTPESLVGELDRIGFYDNKIFVLDKRSNIILIFDKTGKFLTKIQRVGAGPSEYTSLTDFAVDAENSLVILYTDRPYKILTFDFHGNFVAEKKLEHLYTDIAYADGKLLLKNGSLQRKFMLFEQELSGQSENGLLAVTPTDLMFDGSRLRNPSLIKDKWVHISFPYSDTVYRYSEGRLTARYRIDFGDKTVPQSVISDAAANQPTKTFSAVFKFANEHKYAFGITNFRESDRFTTFSYGMNKMVIYSKETRSSSVYSGFVREEDGMMFVNYFAHDGTDNSIVSVLNADNFQSLIADYRAYPDSWEKLSEETKKLANTVTDLDNPLLIIYTFK